MNPGTTLTTDLHRQTSTLTGELGGSKKFSYTTNLTPFSEFEMKNSVTLLKGLTKAEGAPTHCGLLHAFVATSNYHLNK